MGSYRIRLKIFAESLRESLIIVRESGLLKAMGGILLLTFIAAVAVMFFELQNPTSNMISSRGASFAHKFWETIWWALITMTTVGYGDKYPITTGGRVVGVFVAFSGVALLSIFTATISSVLVARKIKEGKGLQNIHWKDHILLCGWNFQVEQLLQAFESIARETHPAIVLVNDVQEEIIHDLILRQKHIKVKFVRGDFSNEATLQRANIKFARAAIILPDLSETTTSQADDKTLLSVLVAKSLNPKLKVYAHILNPNNASHFRHAEVDEFILRDGYTSFLLAQHVVAPGVPQFFDALMNLNTNDKVQRVAIPPAFVGKTVAELQEYFRFSRQAIFLGIVSEEEPFDVRDILAGEHSYLDAYIERKLKESGRGGGTRQKTQVAINPPHDYRIQERDYALILAHVYSPQ